MDSPDNKSSKLYGALKRAGAVACLPLAGVWYVSSHVVGTATLVVAFPTLGLYAAGKYIATGRGVDADKYFGYLMLGVHKMSIAPFYFLLCQDPPVITLEPSGTPQTVADLVGK